MCVHYPEGNCTPDTTLFNARTYAKYRKNRTGWISSLFSHQRPHSIHVGIKRRSSKWFVKLVSFELCTKVTCCLCGWHCPSARERAVREWEGIPTVRVKCDKYLNATLCRAFMFIQQLALLFMSMPMCVLIDNKSWVECFVQDTWNRFAIALIDRRHRELHANVCYRFHSQLSRSASTG